jgi:hypothetical protein
MLSRTTIQTMLRALFTLTIFSVSFLGFAAAEASKWPCLVCTFANSQGVDVCALCEEGRRPGGQGPVAQQVMGDIGPANTWDCKACSYKNGHADAKCAMCKTPQTGESSQQLLLSLDSFAREYPHSDWAKSFEANLKGKFIGVLPTRGDGRCGWLSLFAADMFDKQLPETTLEEYIESPQMIDGWIDRHKEEAIPKLIEILSELEQEALDFHIEALNVELENWTKNLRAAEERAAEEEDKGNKWQCSSCTSWSANTTDRCSVCSVIQKKDKDSLQAQREKRLEESENLAKQKQEAEIRYKILVDNGLIQGGIAIPTPAWFAEHQAKNGREDAIKKFAETFVAVMSRSDNGMDALLLSSLTRVLNRPISIIHAETSKYTMTISEELQSADRPPFCLLKIGGHYHFLISK